MKISYLLLSGVILTAIMTQSCTKEENKNVNDALISGNWRISAATISGPSIPTTSAIGVTIDSCEADDIFNFEANGVLIKDAGAIKCGATDPQVDTTTWALTSDESALTIDALSFSVVSHTNTNVVISTPLAALSGDLTITLTQN